MPYNHTNYLGNLPDNHTKYPDNWCDYLWCDYIVITTDTECREYPSFKTGHRNDISGALPRTLCRINLDKFVTKLVGSGIKRRDLRIKRPHC